MIKAKGLDELFKKINNLPDSVDYSAHKMIVTVGTIIQSEAKQSIQGHQSQGIAYQKEKPDRNHVASKPHNPPNTDTGRLVGSIKMLLKKNSVRVGSALDYAAFLEFGTRKIVERPWLYPAMRIGITRGEKLAKEAIAEAIKKAGL